MEAFYFILYMPPNASRPEDRLGFSGPLAARLALVILAVLYRETTI